MADCKWTKISGGRLQCEVCGWVYPRKYDKDPASLHRNCPKAKGGNPAPPPNVELSEEDKKVVKEGSERLGVSFKDAKHYAIALARWGKAGFPTRSDEEVERYEATCRACEHYTDGRCRKCGCRVNTGPAVTNKIRMATENCPIGKWNGQPSTDGYQQRESGLLVPGEKKPLLAGMQPEDLVPNPFGPMLPLPVMNMGRRRCCKPPIPNPCQCECSIFVGDKAPCCWNVSISGLQYICSGLNKDWHLRKTELANCEWSCTQAYTRNYQTYFADLTLRVYEIDGYYHVEVKLYDTIWDKNFGTDQPTCTSLSGVIPLTQIGTFCGLAGSVCSISPQAALEPCDCSLPCSSCIDGKTPFSLLATISGVENDACTVCEEHLNKSFVVSPYVRCYYRYSFIDWNPCTTPGGYLFCIDGPQCMCGCDCTREGRQITYLMVGFGLFGSGGLIRATVEHECKLTTWELFLDDPVDCMNLQDLVIPLDSTDNSYCAGSPTLLLSSL